ncbi:SH3 domain-containing protein [Nocardioides ungokensis]|uniref:mucin-2 protein n=1 Tax=Nocardioides ungokensis TaxID=1643322 RepID=UPI0015DF845B|nr:mucin-2 protein [Nocardioides ungokensis]
MAHSHKRETPARRKLKSALVAGPLTVLATGTAITVGAIATHLGSVHHDAISSQGATTQVSRSSDVVSRSESRLAQVRGERYLEQLKKADDARQTQQAIRHAHEHLWTTAPLNLWTGPETNANQVGLVDEGTKVLTTGRRSGDRAELVVDGNARWVTAAYLSVDRPRPPKPPKPPKSPSTPAASPSDTPSSTPTQTPSTTPSTTGLSTAPCPDGSVENGLTSEAVLVYRAVCHAFPQIQTYLGWDAHGEHASGKAIDIMTSDKALGDQIAAFLQSHASELDLYDVIWWDRIWTPVRASEGWRDYGDHGSPTANHMDHVHVSTNG